MTSQLSALDGTDNFNYLMALQDICSKIDSDSDSRRNSVAANSNFFSPFSLFLWSGNSLGLCRVGWPMLWRITTIY